jgi:plastocyanin
MTPRWLALPAVAIAAAATIPATALGGAHAARTATVPLREFRFHPRNLTISRGDTVKWVWRDEVEHNVTFRHFHSHTQIHGSYTVRFRKAGTFKYECTLHGEEGMRGKITVR